MNIFELIDAIQINPKWHYDTDNHKWTINESDVVIHSDITTEIYQDFYKLEEYSIAIEEALDVYDKLNDQLIKNNDIITNRKVCTNDVILSNECLVYCSNVLGYDKYSTVSIESDMSNYDCLQLSTEGIKDLIKEIIEKIKNAFKVVFNFFKNLFIKILRWLGLWENKLENMHNEIKPVLKNSSNEDYYKDMQRLRVDFNNILNRNPLNIKKETLNKIFNTFPIACLTMSKPNTFKELFESINIKDILRPVTLELDNTLKLIFEGKYKDLNSSKLMKNVKEYIDKKIKDDDLEVMYITTLNKPIKYLEYNTKEKEITGYKEFEIYLNDLSNPSDYLAKSAVISTYDIEQAFEYVQYDIMPRLKYYEKDIKKIHTKLDKLINEIDKDIEIEDKEQLEKNKHNLKLIKSFGVDIPNDINAFMFTMVKKYIKILTLIYEDIKDGGKLNLYNFINYVKLNGYTQAEIKYIDNNKNLPYVDLSGDFWQNLTFNYGLSGGLAFYRRIPELDALFGKDNDYTNIVFIDSEWLDGKVNRLNIKNRPKEFYIEILEAYLKQLNLKHLNYNDFENFKKEINNLFTNGNIDDLTGEVLNRYARIISKYDNYNENDYPITKFSSLEKKIIYYHELGHILMRQNESIAHSEDLESYKYLEDRYLYSMSELEADAFAMLMTSRSIKEMAKFRCLKLMPDILSTKIEVYTKNLTRTIPRVKPWVKLNTMTKVLNFLKGN